VATCCEEIKTNLEGVEDVEMFSCVSLPANSGHHDGDDLHNLKQDNNMLQ
jgi:hypothetical protein